MCVSLEDPAAGSGSAASTSTSRDRDEEESRRAVARSVRNSLEHVLPARSGRPAGVVVATTTVVVCDSDPRACT